MSSTPLRWWLAASAMKAKVGGMALCASPLCLPSTLRLEKGKHGVPPLVITTVSAFTCFASGEHRIADARCCCWSEQTPLGESVRTSWLVASRGKYFCGSTIIFLNICMCCSSISWLVWSWDNLCCCISSRAATGILSMMSPNMTPAFMVSRLRQTCWHKGSQSHALWAVMEGGFMFKALARASICQDKVSSQQNKPEKSLFNWKLPRRNHNASLCRRSGCPINFCAALSVYRMSSARHSRACTSHNILRIAIRLLR